MNIVNMAMSYLGPTVVSKIASSLGIEGRMVNTLIGTALPAILGGLSGSSRTGAGAGALFNVVKNMAWGGSNSNALESALDGGSIANFAKDGGDALGGLLGGQSMGALSSMLSKSNGVSEETTGSLLGMLGPIALGSLRDRVDEDGMDAQGLAQFLGNQQSNIAGAMPASFMSDMQGSGMMDQLGDAFSGITGGIAGGVSDAASAASGAVSGAAGAATAAAGAAVGTAAHAASSAADAAGGAARGAANMAGDAVDAAGDAAGATAKKGMGILPWIIIAVIIAALAWFFFGGSKPDVAEMPSAENIMVGDVNISEKFSTGLEGFTGALGSVTDAASAEAALPQIESFGTQLDEISGMAGDLPDAAKGALGGIAGTAMETVGPMIESVTGMAGVGDILGPVLSGIMEKLTALAG